MKANHLKKHIISILCFVILFSIGCKSVSDETENAHRQEVPILVSKSDTVWIEVESIGYRSSLIISEADSIFDINLGEKGRQYILELNGGNDSLKFQYQGNNTENAIVTNGFDSTFVKVYFGGVQANFTSSYIKKNSGKILVEIPPVYELANVAFALTKIGKTNPNMISKNTSYYTRMLDHFNPSSSHTLIQNLQENAGNDYGYYLNVRSNSYSYKTENHSILAGNIYSNIRGGTNYFSKNIDQFRDFAHESNFYEFYENNRVYYDSLSTLYNNKMPIREMWDWLEDNFPETIDGYKIILSPLVGSSHTTVDVKDNNYKEILMFVNIPDLSSVSDVAIGNIMRNIFTEINHNYVNPVSDQYLEDINKSIGDYRDWTSTGSSTYHSAYATFNEYMTWGVFTLFAHDYFGNQEFEKINSFTENSMVQGRKFYRFKEFNTKLLDLYRNKGKDKTVAQLYPAILEWIRTYNH